MRIIVGRFIVAGVAVVITASPLAARRVRAQAAGRILVGPNIMVNVDRDGAMREPWIAVHPTDPKQVLIGATLDRTLRLGFQHDRAFLSLDAGSNWRPITFPEAVMHASGDPQVAWGRTGTALFTTLLFLPGGGGTALASYRSADTGMTWERPVIIGRHADHDMIVVDHSAGPFAGRIYVAILQSLGHGRLDYHISLFRSLDDGRSWIGPVEVANNHDDRTMGRQVYHLGLFSDGELFIPMSAFPATSDVPKKKNYFLFATSRDGGATASAPKRLTASGGELPASVFDVPRFAVDNSPGAFRDRVYALWSDAGQSAPTPEVAGTYRTLGKRLMLSYSTDRGQHWSAPRAIAPGEPGVGDQISSMIAVNNEGTVAVTWYDTRETASGAAQPIIRRYVTASVDGGETFLPARPLASAPTDFQTVLNTPLYALGSGAGFALSDATSREAVRAGGYFALAAAPDGAFHAAWPDGRSGLYRIWTAQFRVDRPTPRAATEPGSARAEPAVLVEADVTDSVKAVADPSYEAAPAGTIAIPIRLQNNSRRAMYGPFIVTAASLQGKLLNAANGSSAAGATMDYSKALGDFESLAPGAVTDAVVWRFAAPSTAKEFPLAKLKVRARVEAPKAK